MSVKYRYGQAGLEALAKQAGEAQAAQVQLDRQWKKDMAEMEYKFRLASEERSRLWELEKMEIASRNDFMRSEQKRVQEQEEFDAKIKNITDAGPSGTGQITQQQVDDFVLDANLKRLGLQTMTEREQRAAMLEARKDPLQELLKQKMGEGKVETEKPTAAPVPTASQIVRQGLKPLSEVAPVDLDIENGRINVISPEGVKGTIPISELEEKKKAGFYVQPKKLIWEKIQEQEPELEEWLERFKANKPKTTLEDLGVKSLGMSKQPLTKEDRIRLAQWEEAWKKARKERGIEWEGFNLPEFIMQSGKHGLKPLTDAQFKMLFSDLERGK